MSATETCVELLPRRSVVVRLMVLGALAVLFAVGCSRWSSAVISTVLVAVALGTYPEVSVEGGCLVRRLRVLFWPVSVVRTSLKPCWQIDIELEWRPSMGFGFLLGIWNWISLFIFDRIFPWFGGDYKLWLRLGVDQRVLAWQGNGEDNFRHNVDVLEEATGLTAVRA
jgi:hypothetical protein